MDSSSLCIWDEIKVTLEETCSLLESYGGLNGSFCKVKNQVKNIFAKQVQSLKYREQSLLDELDNICESQTAAHEKHYRKLLEVRGKLECCLESSKWTHLDKKKLSSYAQEILDTYNNLLQQDNNIPTLSIHADEHKLLNLIKNLGAIHINVPDKDDTSSQFSWDLADSDRSSVDSTWETKVLHGSHSNSCGTCNKPAYDIEEINKYFSDGIQNVPLDDVCKANEMCTSFSNCVCEEPCHVQYKAEKCNYSKFVTAIGDAFQDIKGGKVTAELWIPKRRSNITQTKFHKQTLHMEKQFSTILNSSTPWSLQNHSTTPVDILVDNVTTQMNAIIHSSKEEVLTAHKTQLQPSAQSDCCSSPAKSLPCNMNGAALDIKNQTLNTNNLPGVTSKLEQTFNAKIDLLTGKLHQVMGKTVELSEKLDVSSKTADVSSPLKCPTVQDLHAVITGILEC